ncbi:hypothetical protein [Paludifilum halophilum]|uniref:Uncharacterized protein n=1 Tax=Paludifilum halophilum TaxID=1642702 RepID=A0A235B2F8_9BACL|nr:hypothetical protein [Paludifilum halophilum]OYD06463.1 hypothetical protein CHM34_16355 [Paludifilum halophilum]
MFSKLKRFFDWEGAPVRFKGHQELYKEMEQLKRENEELAFRLQQRLKKPTPEQKSPHKIHIEFFLYDSKNQEETAYSEADIHRYPMMGFTIHFLDGQGRESQPEWLSFLLTGLENTFEAMKVSTHRVERQDLYSQFIDLKLYPQVEVRKCIYLVFQQLYQWQLHGKDQVSFRVHIGGDDLYQELLNSHLEAV